jgi:hypothetical protein
MRRAKFLFAALILVGTTAWAPTVSPDAAIDEFVRAYIKRHAVPSAAIAVVHNGRIVKASGYGTANVELDVPATDRSLYEIGSITKQFTAEAVMALVEEGKLGLDDPIARHLPGTPPAWSAITIRHLLSRRFVDLLAAVAEGRDSELLVDRLRNPGKASRLPASLGYRGDLARFALLERVDLGERGEEKFGNIVRWLYRYRLVSKAGTIYYTFQVTPDGKVASLVPEKE